MDFSHATLHSFPSEWLENRPSVEPRAKRIAHRLCTNDPDLLARVRHRQLDGTYRHGCVLIEGAEAVEHTQVGHGQHVVRALGDVSRPALLEEQVHRPLDDLNQREIHMNG
jgi:hypothetical protein